MFKRIASFTSALVLSLSSMFVFAPVMVHAAVDTCTWTGAVDLTFSNGGNWAGCDNSGVPENGDSLVFNNTGMTQFFTLNNNLSSASFANITFQGSSPYGYTISGNAFTVTGNITSNAEALSTINPNITFTSNPTITVTDNPLSLSGTVSGSGNLTKTGSGALNFYGAYNLTGSVTLSAGAIDMRAYSTDAPFSSLTVANGTVFAFNAFDFSGISGSIFTFTKPITTGGTLNFSTIGAGGTFELDFTGDINLTANTTIQASDNLSVHIKGALLGPGFSVLAGGSNVSIVNESTNNTSSTPNGNVEPIRTTTTIAAGDSQPGTPVYVLDLETVIINGVRGDVQVNSGGILKGTGTVGQLDVNSGGKLAPGESPGCINSGNLTFVAGSTYEFEVGGPTECTEYDQTKVTGTVTLGNGTLSTVRYNNIKPVKGQSYKIIDNDGADAVTGTFLNLAEGATFTVDGYVLKISYVGDTGNDVVLIVQSVPTVPDTGFKLLQNNPILTLVTTSALAGAMMLIAKKYGRSLNR